MTALRRAQKSPDKSSVFKSGLVFPNELPSLKKYFTFPKDKYR